LVFVFIFIKSIQNLLYFIDFLFKDDIKYRFLKIQAIVAAQAVKTFYRGYLKSV